MNKRMYDNEQSIYYALTDDSRLERLASNVDFLRFEIPSPGNPVRLGDFEVREILGNQGNTSITCKAVALGDGPKYEKDKEYVVKGIVKKDTPQETMSSLRMFINELRIFANLKDPDKHNIASLVASNDHIADGPLYMVFPEIPYQTMREKSEDKSIDPVILLPFLDGIATALVYLHRNKIIHGDIKDENIRITSQGVPNVFDLGGAFKKGDGTKFRNYWSPHFSPPEFHKYYLSLRNGTKLENPKDGKHDVYSLGVLAYKLLTADRLYGHIVRPGETLDVLTVAEHAAQGITPVRQELLDTAQYASSVSGDVKFLRGWISSLTEPNKRQRPSMFDAHMQLIEHLGRDRRLSAQMKRVSERKEKAKSERLEISSPLKSRKDMMQELNEYEIKKAREKEKQHVQESVFSFSEIEDPMMAEVLAAKRALDGDSTDAVDFN